MRNVIKMATAEFKALYTYRIKVIDEHQVQIHKLNSEHKLQGELFGKIQRDKLKEIERLSEDIDNNTSVEEKQFRHLGKCLFDMLFDSIRRQDFVNTYLKVVRQDRKLLRVELDIDEYKFPDLAALPWEFMTLSERDQGVATIWLGTSLNIAFSRRYTQWYSAQKIKLLPNEKVRIALAVAAPNRMGHVEHEEVQERLEELARNEANCIELLPVVKMANPETIDQLMEKRPHIFHFIGHGRVDEVAFSDDFSNHASWVNASYFSERFSIWRPGVVLLQACEGGKSSKSKEFSGVALEILRQQDIPVVVAMQHEISNDMACRFVHDFYKCLVQGEPVDVATQKGRYSITQRCQYGKRDFATPTIFMQVEDGYPFLKTEWEKELEFDESITLESITRINNCLDTLSNTDYTSNLTPEEYLKLVSLNEDVKTFQKHLNQELRVLVNSAIESLEISSINIISDKGD